MARHVMAIAYDSCTGCHTCEVSCRMEHGFPEGQNGIKVTEYGPWEYGDNKWNYDCIPAITQQCDTCAERRSHGKKPACVHSCFTACMKFGTMEEVMDQIAADEEKFGREAKYVMYYLEDRD